MNSTVKLKVRPVPVPAPPKSYTLTLVLNQDDAEALYALSLRIAGCPETTFRKTFDDIRFALDAAEVSAESEDFLARGGEIRFLDRGKRL